MSPASLKSIARATTAFQVHQTMYKVQYIHTYSRREQHPLYLLKTTTKSLYKREPWKPLHHETHYIPDSRRATFVAGFTLPHCKSVGAAIECLDDTNKTTEGFFPLKFPPQISVPSSRMTTLIMVQPP